MEWENRNKHESSVAQKPAIRNFEYKQKGKTEGTQYVVLSSFICILYLGPQDPFPIILWNYALLTIIDGHADIHIIKIKVWKK